MSVETASIMCKTCDVTYEIFRRDASAHQVWCMHCGTDRTEEYEAYLADRPDEVGQLEDVQTLQLTDGAV